MSKQFRFSQLGQKGGKCVDFPSLLLVGCLPSATRRENEGEKEFFLGGGV